MITPEHILKIMNEAFEADPIGIQGLLIPQVQVNEKLANHPTIQVRTFPANSTEPIPVLTVLGLINGFLGGTGQFLCSLWSDTKDKNGAHTFLGFCLKSEEEIYGCE